MTAANPGVKTCGVEIKGSEVIFACAERDGAAVRHVPLATRKIGLDDDEQASQVKAFAEQVQAFVKAQGIGHLVVKKRSKKGEFAGGPVTFKIEGVLQLLVDCDVTLVSPQTISASARKHDAAIPDSLNKYQWEAWKAACAVLLKG